MNKTTPEPGYLPPEDLANRVEEALFPPRTSPYPPPKTLYDNLREGLNDGDPAPPPLKLPEPVQLIKERQPDELVPAFTRMWRVGLNDFPHLGWVIDRLAERHPHLGQRGAHAALRGFMLDNQFFFQRTEHAIACAVFCREVFAPPYVQLLFLLHQDRGPEGGNLKGSQGERDALQLVRAVKEWGRHQKASEIRRLNDLSDLPPGNLVKELKAERREEICLKL